MLAYYLLFLLLKITENWRRALNFLARFQVRWWTKSSVRPLKESLEDSHLDSKESFQFPASQERLESSAEGLGKKFPFHPSHRGRFDTLWAPFSECMGSHCQFGCFQLVQKRRGLLKFLNVKIAEAKEEAEVSEIDSCLQDASCCSSSQVQRRLYPEVARRCGDLKESRCQENETRSHVRYSNKARSTQDREQRLILEIISLFWYDANKQTGQSILFCHETRYGVVVYPQIAGVTLSTWYDISFLSRKDKLNGYENLAGPCANGGTARSFYTRNSHTCTEECYSTQICKLFFINVQFGKSLDIFVDLANGSCDLFHINWLIFSC